ncbi:MAG: ABC transporter permease [Methanomassiliicoccales archaeon]
MSSLWNIIKKEVKELLTPATLVPIIIFAVIFGMLGNAFGGATEEISKPPKIAIIDRDGSYISQAVYSDFASRSEVIYNGTDVEEAVAQLQAQNGVALFVIQPDFARNISENKSGVIKIYWIMKGAGIMDTMTSASADVLL